MTMTSNSDNEPAFYVVQFIELPFEGIDDYVCVPCAWVVRLRKAANDKAVAAYPIDEDPFDTRDRAKRKERYNDEWRFYMAAIKYESNSYNEAEFWIATRNDYGPLVEEKSKVTGTQPKLSINKKLRSANQNHLSESNDNSWKPLPRISIKRPAQSELKKELDGKRLKLDECAHSSNAVVNDVQESRISVALSKETINDNQENRTDDFSNEPSSHQLLNSQKILANLYRQMNGGRRLVPTQRTVEKRILPMKIKRSVTTSPQKLSNLMDRTISSSTSSVEELPVVTQNQSRDSLGDQKFKCIQQKQLQPTQQDSQRQLQKPKICIGISIKQKNNRQTPTLQGVTKKTLSPILTKVINSVRKALSTSHNNYLLNNQQFQASPSDSVLVNDSSLPKVMSNACQPDECMIDETLSPYHAVTSDSDAVTDQEVISDHEMSTDEAPAETTNNVYGTANDPGHSSADRPTADQNSMARSRQMNPKFILEQQMLDNFASLFTQMGSTLRHTTDMYNTLRSSIFDIAETYKKLLGAVEQFNTAGNAANNASSSSNPIPDVPQPREERHTTITASASSSNQDQHSNDVANKTPKKKDKKLFRFVLPPEYDAYDSRWTLKYPTYLAGLVELVPESHVYVSYGDLKYCQQVSKDCPSLARRLLPGVFNRNALSVCSSMSETAKASNSVGSNIRPDLDDDACSVLLNFVLEHGLQRGWNTDLKPILSMLHSKMQEIRFKYGVMVEC